MITLTADLAYAAGRDAGNRAMRKRGDTRWSAEDAAIAAATTNRLMLYVPAENGGLQGLQLTQRDREMLGISDAD